MFPTVYAGMCTVKKKYMKLFMNFPFSFSPLSIFNYMRKEDKERRKLTVKHCDMGFQRKMQLVFPKSLLYTQL